MRYLTMLAGVILLLIGLILFVTPIIGSGLSLVAGLGLIIGSSDSAARRIKDYRIRYARLNRLLCLMENKMGERFSQPLRSTRPDDI